MARRKFDESKVNRDRRGQFADKAGGGFAQRISDQIGQRRRETPYGGPRPGDREKKLLGAAIGGHSDELDRASDDELQRLLRNPELTGREQITVRSALARRNVRPDEPKSYEPMNPNSPMPPQLAAVWQRADRAKLRRAGRIKLQQMLVSPGISDTQKTLIRQVLAEL